MLYILSRRGISSCDHDLIAALTKVVNVNINIEKSSVEIEFEDGSTKRERVDVRGRESKISVTAVVPVTAVTLDPDHDLLIWRPDYDAPPKVGDLALSAVAPWVDVSVYEGSYYMVAFNMTSDVYGNDEGLWATADDEILQLYPYEPHRFKSHMGWIEFQIEDGRATGFIVELESGEKAEGVRVNERAAE